MIVPSDWSAAALKDVDISRRMDHCPAFLSEPISQAVKDLHVERVIIYGSRARGDHSKNSDFDIAFDFDQSYEKSWPKFKIEILDEVKTLLALDLLNLRDADTKLRETVRNEGVVLYERV